ncbi:unnamed protein product, partial [Mesorhabditis spiculigera]
MQKKRTGKRRTKPSKEDEERSDEDHDDQKEKAPSVGERRRQGRAKKRASATNAGNGSKEGQRSGKGPAPSPAEPLNPLLGPVTPSDPITVGIDAWVKQTLATGILGLKAQWADLKSYQPTNKTTTAFAANPDKNRYPDVSCYDDTRVKLTPEGSAYWPEKPGQFQNHGRFFVANKKLDADDHRFQVFTIELLPDGCSNSRMLRLIQFTRWPDHGVPLRGKTVLRLLRSIATVDSWNQGKTLLHCSAGIGRTGTLLVIDWLLCNLYNGGCSDVTQLVKLLRSQRAHSIQTDRQYIFIHSTVLDYLCTKYPQRYAAWGADTFLAEAKKMNRSREPAATGPSSKEPTPEIPKEMKA